MKNYLVCPAAVLLAVVLFGSQANAYEPLDLSKGFPSISTQENDHKSGLLVPPGYRSRHHNTGLDVYAPSSRYLGDSCGLSPDAARCRGAYDMQRKPGAVPLYPR